MDKHRRKMIAPIVVTILMILYFIFYFTLLIHLLGGAFRIILGIAPAVMAVVMISVCVQRIKEIRSGEEDDLGQY